MKEVRYAIIGLGAISQRHIDVLKNIPNAKLVAVCHRHEAKLNRVIGRENIDGYLDYHEMLKRDDIDAVIILTSSGTHAQIGIDVARAGKHVIVEKPIDTTEEKAEQLIKVCHEENVLLSCIFQLRFAPEIVQVKKAIEKNWLGRITGCCCRTTLYRDDEYYKSVEWRGTLEFDGGAALINQSIHFIDLMQFLLGMPDEIFGYTGTLAHEGIEGEDVGVAVAKFANGTLGTIEGTTSAYPGFSQTLAIYGDAGSIIIENDKISYWNLKNGQTYEKVSAIELPHQRQLQNITEAILKGEESLVNGEEALKPLKIVRAIYQSMKENRPIKF